MHSYRDPVSLAKSFVPVVLVVVIVTGMCFVYLGTVGWPPLQTANPLGHGAYKPYRNSPQ